MFDPPADGGIRRLANADLDATTELLVRCFVDDPGYGGVFPPDRREAAVRFLSRRLLAMRLEAGVTVWVVGTPPIAMISFAPQDVRFGVWTYLRHGLLKMPLKFGIGTVRDMLAADDAAGALRREHEPTEPYLWFSQIAVDPAHRGEGLARCLGEAAIAVLDREGLHGATMTTVPDLVGLYATAGFEVRGEVTGDGGFTTWMLVRPPSS